jgi:hypothetical protein
MKRFTAVLVLTGLVLTGCANAPANPPRSDTQPVDLEALLQAASEKTIAAGSARLDFTFEMTAGGTTQQMDGSAELIFGDNDPARMEARMSIRYPSFGQGAPAGSIEMIIDQGPVIYFGSDAFASFLPVETKWIKMDPSTFGLGSEQLAAFMGAQGSPSSAMSFLYGVTDVEEVGAETVQGETTTHYRATVDLRKALDEVTARQTKALRDAIDALERQSASSDLLDLELPVDVWVNTDGYLKQFAYEFSLDGVEGATEGTGMTTVMTLSDLGADFQIDPPPADQVTDISELMPSTDTA